MSFVDQYRAELPLHRNAKLASKKKRSYVESEMSVNLTRPAILNYTVYRKSNSLMVFVDYPDEPDKDIYKRRAQLNRPPISYMHTR